jgi:thiamine-phosphate pyrophosphorylase
MAVDFKVIVITPEHIFEDEAKRIATLLDSGVVWRVHIRHPHASACDICKILDSVPCQYYNQISLHDCHNLASKYKGLGIHLNGRNPFASDDALIVSKSCHSLHEVLLSAQNDIDYVTLSPIYNSISKPGYNSSFELFDAQLLSALKRQKVIALGGVTPDKFQQLRDAGFAGAALLGYVWRDDYNDFIQSLSDIRNYKLQLCCNL